MEQKGSGRSFIRRQRHKSDRVSARSPADARSGAPDNDDRVASGTPKPGDAWRAPHRPDDRERIVIPRQQRGAPAHSELDIELREVKKGLKAGNRYLRVVPRERSFMRREPGYIEATRLASRPRGRVERFVATVKGIVLGSPFATSQAMHERLTKVKALAVFSSDVLSSSAYATEEILLVLVLAGTSALTWSIPIALVITLLLAIVTLSYRQTIRAYPQGGGAYRVAHNNLGRTPGLVAASALLVDYVLTVAVSVAAGVAAVTSAVPGLIDVRVLIGVVVVALIAVGNLRGIRESGTIFAAPTYFFIAAMVALIITGIVKVLIGDAPGSLMHSAPPETQMAATQGLSLLLILRAFSSGSTALTGTEAISDGVPAFKPPEAVNARTTLTVMAFILGSLFLGITFLVSRYGLVPSSDETIVSKLGRHVFGENPIYYGYQVATALVLFLAANTSFADFPRLSAFLAIDRFMPRQFAFRGDRLAFSNGIMLLAGSSAVLLVLFKGEVSKLIPLYAVGVFVSFTLSQSGMVRRWWRLREKGWRTSLAINGVGAAATAVVALIIAGTKFTHGAWISILMMITLMIILEAIRRHYDWFQERIRVDESELPLRAPPAVPLIAGDDQRPDSYLPPRDHVIVPVDGVNKISLGAIAMGRELSSMVTAVHLTDDRERAEKFREEWNRAVPDVPLLVVESPYRAFVAPMLAYLESLVRTEPQRITVILPSFVARHWWERLLHNRDVLRLKPFLRERPSIRVVEFPYRLAEEENAA